MSASLLRVALLLGMCVDTLGGETLGVLRADLDEAEDFL